MVRTINERILSRMKGPYKVEVLEDVYPLYEVIDSNGDVICATHEEVYASKVAEAMNLWEAGSVKRDAEGEEVSPTPKQLAALAAALDEFDAQWAEWAAARAGDAAAETRLGVVVKWLVDAARVVLHAHGITPLRDAFEPNHALHEITERQRAVAEKVIARDGLRALASVLQVCASRVTAAVVLNRTIDLDTLRNAAETLRAQASVLDEWIGMLAPREAPPHPLDREKEGSSK
jgi:hypothetical protein